MSALLYACSVSVTGPRTPSQVSTIVAAVPLSNGLLELTGLTVASDVTSTSGSSVTRLVTLNMTSAFLARFTTFQAQLAAPKGWMQQAIALATRAQVAESVAFS